MATKEAVFKLRVDTGNSVQDVTNADTAVKSFNTTLKDTQKTTADNKASQNFATQLDAIKAKVNAGGLGIRELSRVIREYQSLAIAAGEDSVIGRESIAAAGELKDRIGDLQNQTKVASSDFKKLDLAVASIGTGAAVFQGLQGAIALAGSENENLTKTMVKLQAAQGIANAVSQVANALNKDAVLGIQLRIAIEKIKNFVIGDTAKVTSQAAAGEGILSTANTGVAVTTGTATLAMRAFRLALISTGVGALVVGLGALIANYDKLFGSTKKLTEAQKAAIEKAKEEREEIAKQSSSFALLISRLKDTTKGSAERAALIKTINSQYGTTLKNLDDEAKFQFAVNKELASYLVYQRAKYALQKNEDLIVKNLVEQDELKDKILQTEKDITKQQKQNADDIKKANKQSIGGISGLSQTDKASISASISIRKLNRELATNKENLKNAEKAFENYGKLANEATSEIAKLTNGGKKYVEQTVKNTTTTKDNSIALKENLNVLKNKLEREQDAFEKSKDIMLSMLADGKNKELAILEETYGDFRNDLIKKANQNEIDALDKKFEKGKIKEKEYREGLKKIMETGADNFNVEESMLMEVATIKFNNDKRRLKLTAQELEIEDTNRALTANEITQSEHAEKILEINDKYTKIERDKAAKKESDRRASNAIINAIILNETELALVNQELAFIDSQKKLEDLLNSTNVNEKITKEQHDAALIALEKKKQETIDKIKEDGVKKAKELATKQFLEDNENLTKFIENAHKTQQFAEEINSVLNGFADQRLQENANKRDADLANLDSAQQKELSQIGLTDQQKKQIEEKFAMQKYKIQLAAFNAEDKINRAKFVRDKALKMTGIVINTAEAVMKSIANNGGVPAGIPFGIASGILGAAQLAVVANSKYQSGAAPAMPQLSSGGDLSGASGGQLSTPSTTQSTTLTSGLPGVAASTSGQVFVLESDITAVQNTVFVAEAKTKF